MKRTLLLAALLSAASSMSNVRAAEGPTCTIPKAWGKLVMVYPQISGGGGKGFDALVFEDESGTLRKTSIDGCKKGKPDWEVGRE